MANDAAPLDDRLGFLLKTAYAQLAQRVDAALAPLDLTARQLAVLSVIAADGALSQAALGERLGVDRTTIVAMLDELESRGLVERRRDARDRRRNALALTRSGRARVARGETARAAAQSDYLSPLGEPDARRLIAALQGLIGRPGG
jgi:DNA-binding MarR family transcriptional regulator